MFNRCLSYRSWKYWHSPMIHAKAMAVVIAYDIYLECCFGELDSTWKRSRPVDFHRFREKLAIQMLTYSPKRHKYPGDEKFRVCTKMMKKDSPRPFNKKRKHGDPSGSTSAGSYTTTSSGVSVSDLEENADRLCGSLNDILLHEQSLQRIKKNGKLVCIVCGQFCYYRCMR